MTRVLERGSVSSVALRKPPKTGRNAPRIEPAMFAGVERFPEPINGRVKMVREWALYVSVVKEGDFRRLPLMLPEARRWLSALLAEVDAALVEEAKERQA